MRYLALACVLGFALAFAVPVQAAGEFGEYFTNQQPAGFSDPQAGYDLIATDMDALAASLQEVAPAAGGNEAAADSAQYKGEIMDLPGAGKAAVHNHAPANTNPAYIKDDLSP